jgi:hypothetical protein
MAETAWLLHDTCTSEHPRRHADVAIAYCMVAELLGGITGTTRPFTIPSHQKVICTMYVIPFLDKDVIC